MKDNKDINIYLENCKKNSLIAVLGKQMGPF